MSLAIVNQPEPAFAPKMRVEWRTGTRGDVEHGTLIEPDNGLGGPWWLVDVDGEDTPTLVKTWALYPEGWIRREEMANTIHGVMRVQARRHFGAAGYRPAWSDALAIADAVIAAEAAR